MDIIKFDPQTRAAGSDAAAAPGRRHVTHLAPQRLQRAKRAFATRRVALARGTQLLAGACQPHAGDLVLARVDRLGQHTGLQLPDGRRARIFPGDEIVVAYGARYAPNQFESVVPPSLGPCHLVAAGGMASRMQSRHQRIKRATDITPLGLIVDAQQRRLNLRDFALPALTSQTARGITTVAVAGTAMDAGKTTAAADLILGLSRAGLRVGAAKVTGTGACGDYFAFVDAGAAAVLDFTDLGYGSTCGAAVAELETILEQLTEHLAAAGAEVIVLEIADGLLQAETAAVLQSPAFAEQVDSVVFCAPDALGARGGVEWLEEQGLHVSAVAGALTAAPLAVREAAAAIRLPVLTREDLSSPLRAMDLLAPLRGTDATELQA
jgi:hypothetical protein